MKCFECRREIDRLLREGLLPEERGELAAHLRDCPLCREAYSDALLTRTLRDEPVPEPDEAFADRVMDRAIRRSRQRSRTRMFRGLSAAAALLLVFFVGYLVRDMAQSPVIKPRHVQMVLVEGREHRIGILIRAEKPRRDAAITVDLQGRIALKDQPGRRSISWRTDLVQGKNLLELPIELLNGSGGRVRVGYRYDSVEQELSIRVKPSGGNSRDNTAEI